MVQAMLQTSIQLPGRPTCIISSENHGMGGGAKSGSGKSMLKFAAPDTKVNKDYYINDVLTPVLLPEANGLNPNGDWIFQQDGTTAHTVNANAVLVGASLCWIHSQVPMASTQPRLESA